MIKTLTKRGGHYPLKLLVIIIQIEGINDWWYIGSGIGIGIAVAWVMQSGTKRDMKCDDESDHVLVLRLKITNNKQSPTEESRYRKDSCWWWLPTPIQKS